MSILAQGGPAKLANESLNTIKGESEQLAWYRGFYELDRLSQSAPLIGSKQNLRALFDPARLARLFMADGIKVVRMRRDNIVKVTVSQIRGEQYALKTKAEGGQARWAVRTGDSALGPSVIEPSVLYARIQIMQKMHDRLMALLPAADVLDIEYEDVSRNLDHVVGSLRLRLGLGERGRFAIPFMKATPDRLQDAIANFDEIRASLAGTPYAQQLES